MKKKLVKLLTICLSIATFVLSHSSISWAKALSDITPYDYIMLMTFAACGIDVAHTNGQWVSTYKGYLQSINDTAMLNQLDSYSGLSWGDTATNTDDLYHSVKQWLSLSPDYGTETDFYSLPSMPSPQLNKVSSGQYSISSTPFSDVNPIPLSGYDFLFSQVYTDTVNGRVRYIRANYYIPSGLDIFCVMTGINPYNDEASFKICKKDADSATGFSFVPMQKMQTIYFYDDDTLSYSDKNSSVSNFANLDIRSASNFPFKVFGNSQDAETYAKTGVANHLFTSNSCSVWCYNHRGVNLDGVNLDLHTTTANFGDTVDLPASNADAVTAYNAARKVSSSLTEMEGLLNAGGFNLSYHDNYVVKHYQQTVDGNAWTMVDEENLSDVIGNTAIYTIKSYPGFTHDPGLTTPDNLRLPGDNSLVIKLYYHRNLIDYVVNHHQQGLDGKSWNKINTDSRSGLYGSTASYTVNSYPGFTYDAGLTTDKLTLDSGLTIDLYYNRNRINYTVEHYQGLISPGNDTEWTLIDTENLSGLYGAAALYSPKTYKGYTYNSNLTSAGDPVLSDEGKTIKLYYTKPLEVDLFEQSAGNMENIISPAVFTGIMIAAIVLFGLLLLKLFKRTMRQASGMAK